MEIISAKSVPGRDARCNCDRAIITLVLSLLDVMENAENANNQAING